MTGPDLIHTALFCRAWHERVGEGAVGVGDERLLTEESVNLDVDNHRTVRREGRRRGGINPAPERAACNHGRLVAEGHVRDIRDLIDKHPHHIVLVCDAYRQLAGRVLQWPDVEGVRVLAGDSGLMVETRAPDAINGRLPALSLEDGLAIKSVYSDDDNLEAVFQYLVNK